MVINPYRFGGFARHSLLLDGAECVDIGGTRASLAATTKGTILIWSKPVDGTPLTNEVLVAFGDTNANEFLRLIHMTDGDLYADCRDAGTTQWALRTDAAIYTTDVWTMSGIVQDAVEIKMYKNDALAASTFSTTTNKTRWFSVLTGLDNGRIGCSNMNGGGNTLFYNGNLLHIAFFNIDLSAAEISEAYGVGPYDLTTHSKAANLIDFYRLGDDPRDNYDVDVADEWRLYSNGTADNTGDTVGCEEADIELDVP